MCCWPLNVTGNEKSASSMVCSRLECTKVSSRSSTRVFLFLCTGDLRGRMAGRFARTHDDSGGRPWMNTHGSNSSSYSSSSSSSSYVYSSSTNDSVHLPNPSWRVPFPVPDPPTCPSFAPRLDAARTAPSLSVSSASSLSRLLASSASSPSEMRTGSASEMSSESESLDRPAGGSGGNAPVVSIGFDDGRVLTDLDAGIAPGAPVVAALVDARTLLPLAPPRLNASCAFAVFAALADLADLEDEKKEKNGEKIDPVPVRLVFSLTAPFFTLPLRLPPSSSSPSNARLRATSSPVDAGAFETPLLFLTLLVMNAEPGPCA
mmetsp:Transcript_10290/g.46477  ORF Transcript_10290/g.46477 Transcript_10290/m.46477 type:complete len:319 (+) Transcript_10290:494-1450(+)